MIKITYLPSQRMEIVRIHCPECGERVRSIGLDPDDCNVDGLTCHCKRCRHLFKVSAQSINKK